MTAAERQFENWLARQSTARVSCRVNGHWWPGYGLNGQSRLGSAPAGTRHGAYVLSMTCEREVNGEHCGVSRRAYLLGDYTPAVNVYTYPPGYMTPEGVYLTKARRGRMRQELDIRAEEGQ